MTANGTTSKRSPAPATPSTFRQERHTSAPIDARVTPERISKRAYELFLKRNHESGDELSDWLQAEKELGAASDRALHEFAAPTVKMPVRSVAPARVRK